MVDVPALPFRPIRATGNELHHLTFSAEAAARYTSRDTNREIVMQPTGYPPTLFFDWPLHDWTVSVFGRDFGVVQFLEASSTVYIGPFQFGAQLSAPTVASIAAGILVLLAGVAAYVIRGRSKPV